MKTFSFLLTMLFALTTYSQEITSNCEEHTACVITNIKGKCFLRDDDKVQPKPLVWKNSIGKKLLAGQSMQCYSGGHVRIFFCKSKKEIEIKGDQKKWYLVPNVPASRSEDGAYKILGRKRPWKRIAVYFSLPKREQLETLRAIVAVNTAIEPATPTWIPLSDGATDMVARTNSNTGTVASAKTATSRTGPVVGSLGRSPRMRRSVRPRPFPQIIFPLSNSVVLPDKLIFRWQLLKDETLRNEATFTLSLRAIDGVLLWSQHGIDVSLGRFSSRTARASLKKFRAEKPHTSVRFSISDGKVDLQTSVFSPLSVEDEQSLRQELYEINNEEEGFLRHIYRADTFYRRRLYSEEAVEYETIVASSPESEDLLVAAIIANCRANNSRRAVELSQRLPPEHPYRYMSCAE